MKEDYQNDVASAMAPVLPEAVSVVMAELAIDVQEGLLAMAVGAGLQVMAAMMNADVAAVCGPRGKHDPARAAVRHGREDGSVTLGGRRVAVARPRMRAADGSGELPVPSYELFSQPEVLEYRSAKALRPLLEFLAPSGVLPTPPEVHLVAVEDLLGRYLGYLIGERGLTPGTARGYVDFIRPFVATRLRGGCSISPG